VEAGTQVLERAEASDGRPERELVAADGSLSAQFEHTVLVTRDGVEILAGSP
jgi:hypothetical protein